MKTLMKWLCCLSAFFVLGCSSQVSLSIDELPSVPVGKARLVVVFDQDTILWGVTPLALFVDGKATQWIKKLPRFSAIDVEPGERLFATSYPDPWVLDVMEQQGFSPQHRLKLQEGETRYFFCFAQRADELVRAVEQRSPASPYLGTPIYALLMREIDSVEASRLLRVTRVSG